MGLLLSRWLSARRADWEVLKRHGLRPVGGAAAGHVQVAPDSTGKDVDADSLTSTEGGTPTVYRQNVVVGDPTTYAAKAAVSNAAPATTDYGLEVRPIPIDISTSTANLSGAANGTSFAVAGYPGASVNITGNAATFSFKAQVSVDGATTWTDTYLQTVAGITASSFAANGQYSIELVNGASHVRVVLVSITSGTFTYQYRASMTVDGDPSYVGPTGSAVSPVAGLVGGTDGANLQALRVMTSQPVGTEVGLLVRPVNSFPDTTVGSTALAGSNQTIVCALAGQVGTSFQLQAGGTLIATIVGELSIDGGTTWFSTFMEIPGTSQVISSANIGSGQAATQWTVVPAAGASHARLRVSAFTSGTANFIARAAQILDETDEDAGPPNTLMPPIVSAQGLSDGTNIQAFKTPASSGPLLGAASVSVLPPSPYAYYSASKAGGVGVASATDVATIAGSGTKTIYVTRFIFDATIATTAASGTVQLIKRSAADTAGTQTGTSMVPHDANSAAATASVLFYTANPTLGTTIANVRTWRYLFLISAATAVPALIDCEFKNPIVLRGTAQQLACNLSGQGANATTIDVTFEWFEV